jgi:hypothetical protein
MKFILEITARMPKHYLIFGYVRFLITKTDID